MNAPLRSATPSVPTSTTTTTTTITIKRACDACHRRKVKCLGDGTRSCKNCLVARLSCTYNAIPQKKGPRGSRARVITELRESQRQTTHQHPSQSASSSPDPEPRRNGGGHLSAEMILACADFFFANIYPTQPILMRQRVGETVGMMETNEEAFCMAHAFCAYVLIQPNMQLPSKAYEGLDGWQSNTQLGQMFLDEAIRSRRKFDHIENPSVHSVITSFFLFGSYFSLNKHNTAWFHLREATTLALSLGMHDESTYSSDVADMPESSRRRRLYWLLFVTERAYALQQHKPLTLHPTIQLPTPGDDPSETVELSGFLHLVNLFRPFDDTFVGLWNKSRTGCSTEWLAQLQDQLAECLPAYLHSTETQAVDLHSSRQWLRTIVWQLSISQGPLFSAAAEGPMSLKFPIEVSRDLVAAVSQFPKEAMEVHGIGFIEKLFDVACTLTDVMSCFPPFRPATNPSAVNPRLAITMSSSTSSPSHSPSTFSNDSGSLTTSPTNNGPVSGGGGTLQLGPADYLNQLMKLISSLRGGQQRYIPLLLAKISDSMPGASVLGYSLPISPSSTPDITPERAVTSMPMMMVSENAAPTSMPAGLSDNAAPPVSMLGALQQLPSDTSKFDLAVVGGPPRHTGQYVIDSNGSSRRESEDTSTASTGSFQGGFEDQLLAFATESPSLSNITDHLSIRGQQQNFVGNGWRAEGGGGEEGYAQRSFDTANSIPRLHNQSQNQDLYHNQYQHHHQHHQQQQQHHHHQQQQQQQQQLPLYQHLRQQHRPPLGLAAANASMAAQFMGQHVAVLQDSLLAGFMDFGAGGGGIGHVAPHVNYGGAG